MLGFLHSPPHKNIHPRMTLTHSKDSDQGNNPHASTQYYNHTIAQRNINPQQKIIQCHIIQENRTTSINSLSMNYTMLI